MLFFLTIITIADYDEKNQILYNRIAEYDSLIFAIDSTSFNDSTRQEIGHFMKGQDDGE